MSWVRKARRMVVPPSDWPNTLRVPSGESISYVLAEVRVSSVWSRIWKAKVCVVVSKPVKVRLRISDRVIGQVQADVQQVHPWDGHPVWAFRALIGAGIARRRGNRRRAHVPPAPHPAGFCAFHGPPA